MVATCPGVSPGVAASLQAATQPSAQVGAEPEQADEALGVAALGDQVVELRQRPRDDLDPLVLLGLRVLVVQIGGEVEMALLLREAGRCVEARQELPLVGALADLFGELPASGRLRLGVELARRQLEQGSFVDRL